MRRWAEAMRWAVGQAWGMRRRSRLAWRVIRAGVAPVGPAHGFGPGPPEVGAGEADGLEPEDQCVGKDNGQQPGLVCSERLEREPLGAGGFDPGDVVLNAGVAADVEVCLLGGERLVVGPVAPVAVFV